MSHQGFILVVLAPSSFPLTFNWSVVAPSEDDQGP